LLLIVVIMIAVVWRRRGRRHDRKIRRAARDVLTNFLIPDGDTGEIQIAFALLTDRGIVVLDIKDADGHVFGSPTMQDWTVISSRRRYTFANPLPALYDRVAALRRLLPGLPVNGYVAFLERAKFSKGRPDDVVMLDELLDELVREHRGKSGAGGFREGWERLRGEAVSVQLAHLLRAGSGSQPE